ncbi:MAG: cryptochrome/photolyase family protein [Patescibacteria group bacterium]
MHKSLTIVLSDQLFENHFAFHDSSHILMLESLDQSTKLNFHKLRLSYVFTCMRHFRDLLLAKKKVVHYFSLEQNLSLSQAIINLHKKESYTQIKVYDPSNKFFITTLKQIASELDLDYVSVENPMFLTPKSIFKNYLSNTKTKKNLRMADFYIWQRKRLNILLEENQKPVGGSWSFDKDNRKKLPKDVEFRQDLDYFESEYFKSVSSAINLYFPDNPGKIENMWIPFTHSQAKKRLEYFLEHILLDFGDYEDAMTNQNDFVFHSVLSPMLNIGLLTPDQVLSSLEIYIRQNPSITSIKINSIEGFVRQIIGWREWVKGMYDNMYDHDFANLNFFEASKPLPEYFYYPSQHLDHEELKYNLPLRTVLLKVERLSWCHHIERLMILANWMTLNEYNPKECFDWFSSQFVDAGEWVMVPNVMGMGMYSDGGLFTSKPYISGGNYIKKMSNFPDSSTWEKIWTDKFWKFLYKHEEFFQKQPRLSLLLNKRKNKVYS